MERFRVLGVPTVLFLGPRGSEELRLEQLVGPEELLRKMEDAKLLDPSLHDACRR
jgi:thiol:disulfide interchange protein